MERCRDGAAEAAAASLIEMATAPQSALVQPVLPAVLLPDAVVTLRYESFIAKPVPTFG